MSQAAPIQQFVVMPEQRGITVAACLRANVAELTWNQARRLCAQGRVRVEGRAPVDPAARVEAGWTIELVDQAAAARAVERAREVAIAFVDKHVVVVHKPPDLLTVPSEDVTDCLARRVSVALRRRDASGLGTVRVVQRLDKDTTGLLVFARTRLAERELQNQFRARAVQRRYVALVYGRARTETHDTWLVPDRGDGRRGSWGRFRTPMSAKKPEDARRAVTHVEVLEVFEKVTLVACRLETGRQHQIRIHLGEAGNPLLGETVYARGYDIVRELAPRPMLHAELLAFTHPVTGAPLEFASEMPPDFAQVLAQQRRVDSKSDAVSRSR